MSTQHSLSELIKCARREHQMRQRVYPNRVVRGQMSEFTARYEIQCMEEIAQHLEAELQPQLTLNNTQP